MGGTMTSCKNERGSILVFSTVTMVAVLLCASLAIDVGCILTARNQLQSAVDASALAGSLGLLVDQSEASQRAITIGCKNKVINQSVALGSDNVSFPNSSRIRVEGNHNVNMFFSRVVGIHSVNISAVAVAELGTIIGTRDMRPWAVPDMGWPSGAPVVLKSGSLGAPSTVPSFYYAIDFPPLSSGTPETGASTYMDNIINGSSSNVFIGDDLQVEPGNMTGPTQKGVQDLIEMDAGAYWDGEQVRKNSGYPGNSSPRIVKIPLYDPEYPPDTGRNYITVIGLGAFFLQGMNGKDVMGVYMEKVTTGSFGDGYSFLRGARLVQ